MTNFTKDELATIYDILFKEHQRSMKEDTDDAEVEYRVSISNISQKLFAMFQELDDAEKAVKVTHDKTIKPFKSYQELILKGAGIMKRSRTIYTDGERFYAKWYGDYIEVERYPWLSNEAWRTVDTF